jgi:hypothetical protein
MASVLGASYRAFARAGQGTWFAAILESAPRNADVACSAIPSTE